MPIRLPDPKGLTESFKEHTRQTGFSPSFQAYLGNGDGHTVRCPDYPIPGQNSWVYYYTLDNNRVGRAQLDKGIVPYAEADGWYGLPVRIGKLPASAYAIETEVVLGLGGTAGQAAAGGTTPADQSVVNNYYITGDRITQFRLNLVSGSSGFVVDVGGPVVYANPSTNVLQEYIETTVDLSGAHSGIPAGDHRLVVVYLDPITNVLGYVASSTVAASLALPSRFELGISTINALNLAGKIRIGTLYFYYGQTTIEEADILRNLDLRAWFYPSELVLVQAPILAPASSTRNVIQPTAATYIPFTIKGAASQSADLFEIQDSTTAVLVKVTSAGVLDMGSHKITSVTDPSGAQDASTKAYTDAAATAVFLAPASSARNVIQPTGATYIPLTIKGAGSQSADLLDIVDSTNAALVSVNAAGVIFPVQAVTGSAPSYVKGGMYFDTTLNKLRIGGATGWETVTSV